MSVYREDLTDMIHDEDGCGGLFKIIAADKQTVYFKRLSFSIFSFSIRRTRTVKGGDLVFKCTHCHVEVSDITHISRQRRKDEDWT